MTDLLQNVGLFALAAAVIITNITVVRVTRHLTSAIDSYAEMIMNLAESIRDRR